jgi:lysyl-tRNA synthetase class I
MKEENLHEAAAYFRPHMENLQRILKTSNYITFVCHPFVRLVSAFRDKFELGAKNNWIYKMYAADVLDIPEASADKTEAYMRNIYRKIVNLPRPSFSQFVDYLLRTKVENYNDHWLPYWLHCHFCQHQYRVVGRFENILEDTKYIEGKS